MGMKETSSGPKRDPEEAELMKLLTQVGAIGFTVAAAIVGCFLGGYYIGQRFGWGAGPMIGGTLLGVGLSFWWVYRRLLHLAAPRREREADTTAEDDTGTR